MLMKMNEKEVLLLVASTALFLNACQGGRMDTNAPSRSELDNPDTVFEGPVPRADCGPGSMPETDIQGRVSLEDRTSGRSQEGYHCNLELVGQYQGRGTTWVSQSYKHCAYHSQAFPSSQASDVPGVHVVDVRDPTNPNLITRLTSPAFLTTTWESLKVNEARGLLAGVSVGPAMAAVFFDVYDIKEDCLQPTLLNSLALDVSVPANTLGHEGNWAPDGMTYYATSALGGIVTAIDVSDPSRPEVIALAQSSVNNHGLEVSDDGNRLYIADAGLGGVMNNGLAIYDVSEVQARIPGAEMRRLAAVHWSDGQAGQHAIPVTWSGIPHVIFVDESGAGAARIIDISDELSPRVITKLKLEIHMPEHAERRATDSAGNGIFGYEAHYCEADRKEDPTALACGYFESGVRVFDIRDPHRPSEIAYFNPPAQVGKAAELTGSEHAMGLAASQGANLTTDWCSSPPRFVMQPNGEAQLWVTCQDNGFMALRFTNGVWPLN